MTDRESDRELLELAAKAAGIDGVWHEKWRCLVYMGAPPFVGGVIHHTWSPLTDDGDALRLAVKLRMVIDISDEHALASPQESSGAPECVFFGKAQVGHAIHDAESATRRAIVRAAAEIGRQHD